MIKGFFKGILFLALLLAALAAAAYFWLHQPMGSRMAENTTLDLSIEPGTTPKAIAQAVVDAGADASPVLLYAWFRVSGQSRLMRAGSYEIPPCTIPARLLSMLVRG